MAGENAPSLTRLAARRLQQISECHFSPEVRAQASLCLLDTLGAIQYGLTAELAGSLRTYASLNAGRREANAFGCAEQVCAGTAAFTNSVLAHS
jgi:2-methylcitrate dehydratase PrpD